MADPETVYVLLVVCEVSASNCVDQVTEEFGSYDCSRPVQSRI